MITKLFCNISYTKTFIVGLIKTVLCKNKRNFKDQSPNIYIPAFLLNFQIWTLSRENLTLLHANNTGTDQPAHLRRLISAFVIRLLESVTSQVATCILIISIS